VCSKCIYPFVIFDALDEIENYRERLHSRASGYQDSKKLIAAIEIHNSPYLLGDSSIISRRNVDPEFLLFGNTWLSWYSTCRAHLLLLLFSFSLTMASFPIQAFGTTTCPLLPDGVTVLSICVITAFILLTI
jgi:hypothetical protein